MSRSNGQRDQRRRGRQTEQVILFSVRGYRLAIAAEAVHEIRTTDSLEGAATEVVESSLAKVRHRLRRGKRTYYVVSANAHYRLPATRPAMVLVLRDSRAAVLVDQVEGMTRIASLYALPRAFRSEERSWYRGLAVLGDRVIPVVNPSSFLTQQELALLEGGDSGAGEPPRPEAAGA